jgi:hypothetical protein
VRAGHPYAASLFFSEFQSHDKIDPYAQCYVLHICPMISRSHSHSRSIRRSVHAPDRSQCNCNLDLSCSVELVTRAASQSQAKPTLLPHACPHDPVISMEEW